MFTYCLQDGWTVIQSRGQFGNPPDYFNKTWAEYQAGFGTPGMNLKFLRETMLPNLDLKSTILV